MPGNRRGSVAPSQGPLTVKLTAFAPHWITPSNWSDQAPPFYTGCSFLCPHCPADLPEHGPERRRRLVVMFWPPIDPDGLMAKYGPDWWPKLGVQHQRVSGDTFDTLTIAPSIGFDSIGHWHGHIIDGNVRS